MKQLEVEIMGQNYRLSCPEGGEARLHDAVARVDGAMCKIRDNSKIRARDRIAVLAALNMAFDVADQVPATPMTHSVVVPASPVDSGQIDVRLKSLIQRLDTALSVD
jgi:cell division protein ZapA